MCGIFGIMSNTKVKYGDFESLGLANTIRGNINFGVLMDNEIHRYLDPFHMDEIPVKDVKMMLGHVRAPTGGHTGLFSGVHPFETKDLVLAHNGIILNCNEYPEWSTGPVDSQTIIGGIQYLLDRHVPLLEVIGIVAGSLDGQQACWLYYKPTQEVYLWRVMSPIYIDYMKGEARFSSIRCSSAITPISEGVVYRINPDIFCVEPTHTFPYYNPYKKKEI